MAENCTMQNNEFTKSELKKWLLEEVDNFCRRDNQGWKTPIIDTLDELHKPNLNAVFFGGTLRSLLIGRVVASNLRRPRDIDIVVSGVVLDNLREQFRETISRETRFGGLQLSRSKWQFDVWPLQNTWAFVHDSMADPSFTNLPYTTFLNLEAIAVEVWGQPGHQRKMFSGNDQFFDGIINRTVDINKEDNPFPQLCVVRSLILSSSLGFKISPKLAYYIDKHGHDISKNDIGHIKKNTMAKQK